MAVPDEKKEKKTVTTGTGSTGAVGSRGTGGKVTTGGTGGTSAAANRVTGSKTTGSSKNSGSGSGTAAKSSASGSGSRESGDPDYSILFRYGMTDQDYAAYRQTGVDYNRATTDAQRVEAHADAVAILSRYGLTSNADGSVITPSDYDSSGTRSVETQAREKSYRDVEKAAKAAGNTGLASAAAQALQGLQEQAAPVLTVPELTLPSPPAVSVEPMEKLDPDQLGFDGITASKLPALGEEELGLEDISPAQMEKIDPDQLTAPALQVPDFIHRELEKVTAGEVELKQFTDLLEQWLAAAQEQQHRQIQQGVEQGVARLERAEEEARQQLQTQRDQVDLEEARALDDQALYAEARGDRGGIGAVQYAAIQNNASRNRRAVELAQTRLSADTASQIADLRAQGEFESADALLKLNQEYLSQLMSLGQWAAEYNAQQRQWAADYNMGVEQFNTQTRKWQTEFYTQLAQWETQYHTQLRQWAADYNMDVEQFNAAQQQWAAEFKTKVKQWVKEYDLDVSQFNFTQDRWVQEYRAGLEQWAAEYNMDVERFNADRQQWADEYSARVGQWISEQDLKLKQFNTQLDQWAAEFGVAREEVEEKKRETLAQYGWSLLKMGADPTDAMLEAMGIDRAAADSLKQAEGGGKNGQTASGTSSSEVETGGKQDYKGLYAHALLSGNPKSYIANNYKRFGFTTGTGLYDDYTRWKEQGGSGVRIPDGDLTGVDVDPDEGVVYWGGLAFEHSRDWIGDLFLSIDTARRTGLMTGEELEQVRKKLAVYGIQLPEETGR